MGANDFSFGDVALKNFCRSGRRTFSEFLTLIKGFCHYLPLMFLVLCSAVTHLTEITIHAAPQHCLTLFVLMLF